MDGINLRNVEPFVNNPRGNFDLTHTNAFDFRFGDLVPACLLPVMPGDQLSLSHESLVRFAPFISQIYQTYKMSVAYFYVPNRILWDDFDNFIAGGYDGNTEYVEPYIDAEELRNILTVDDGTSSIFDFMNVPNKLLLHATAMEVKIKALPFFAYCKIILDYYLGVGTSLNKIVELTQNRDLCNQGDCTFDFIKLYHSLNTGDPSFYTGDSPIPKAATLSWVCDLIKRLYPLDYFTMARPNPQLGPVMTIPLQLVNNDANGTQTFKFVSSQSGNGQATPVLAWNGSQLSLRNGTNNVVLNGSVFNNVATINDFYSAARIQQLLTMYGFTGFTPSERIAAEYGVKNSDLRLHRSQLLHVDYDEIQIGEVFSNNVNAAGNTPVPADDYADIPGAGTAVAKHYGSSSSRKYEFSEFGWVIGMVSIFPEASYYQGLPKYMYAGDRFDYPHPLLSQLGMQEIKQGEIDWDYTSVSPERTFAYNPRYAEWKVMTNRTHGNLNGNLQYLTNGRHFNLDPAFNDLFLRVDPNSNDLNRSFNTIADTPHNQPLFCKMKFNAYCNRALPYYGLPKY